MAASVSSSVVLTCKHAICGGSELSSKVSSSSFPTVALGHKSPAIVIRAQQATSRRILSDDDSSKDIGRKAALFGLGAAFIVSVACSSSPSANAGIIEDYLDKSKANKELNDKKRLATSGANFARAYTVQFGTCKFPENFTGCQDLAKQKKVPFLSDDLQLECEGKDKYKCGSNVFWKW